ncbi:hypothetical protein NE237_019659 [Protea cynaroides]|uniref:Uncharacterized protein n=1 Tax=Protea cynaroides TaxID=273540 RepID=A0A9Q0K0X5_9MAGN|nr:hypothetical protein NE237_019659 [Protea cynaroides]
MQLDSSEEAKSRPVTKGEDKFASNEQESSSHAVGGNELPAAVAPQVVVVEMAELPGQLGDVRSLVTTLDDQLQAYKTSLAVDPPWVSRFIQLKDTLDAIRHEVTFTQTMLVIEGLTVPMPGDVATMASARHESTRRQRLRSVATVWATYCVDSLDHQDDHGS